MTTANVNFTINVDILSIMNFNDESEIIMRVDELTNMIRNYVQGELWLQLRNDQVVHSIDSEVELSHDIEIYR